MASGNRNPPTEECRFGKDCYRKNPHHFREYNHKHLIDILQQGQNSTTNQYEIPDEDSQNAGTIQEQIKILVGLFPNYAVNAAKKSKIHSEETHTPAVSKQPSVNQSVYDCRTSINAGQATGALPAKPPKNINDYISVVVPKGKMAHKLKAAEPYNFFLTTITSNPATHQEPLSVTMQEILDKSLGEIESSVQINFMVDVGWLLGHYYFAECIDKPLLILYGDETPELSTISEKRPQVTAIRVHMASPFATHHTKMMIFTYKDGSMRVVISTANLYEDDWHNRVQGLWISPQLQPLSDDADTATGCGRTGFRDDLIRYLMSYNLPKLQPVITRLRRINCEPVNVFLVASVPGGHRKTTRDGIHQWGHARLGYLLSQHCEPIPDNCPLIAQSSSIGSLGANVEAWALGDFGNSMRKDNAPIGLRKLPQFKMIYPSLRNVKGSHDDLLGGGCLPYSKSVNDKQNWLKQHLHQWRSEYRNRNQAMPHIKTYCRWSDRGLFWFLLTSANLSKAAWGAFNKTGGLDPALRISNYECGVLFLPKFIINEPRFRLGNTLQNGPAFPMPYDIPLTPYALDDIPFVMDYLRN